MPELEGRARRKCLRFELIGVAPALPGFHRAHGADIVGIKENEKRMTRILLIGQEHATAERLGLQCLERGIGVVIAENVCEGVRALATSPVSLIVADCSRLRLDLHDQASLFDRVAPGVRVAVTVPADAPIEARVALELAGFQVVSAPATPDELLKPLP